MAGAETPISVSPGVTRSITPPLQDKKDASPSQGDPQYPISGIHLGEERQCGMKTPV